MKAILKADHRPSVAIDSNGDLQIMHNADCLTIEGLDLEQTCLLGHAIVREGHRAAAIAELAPEEPAIPLPPEPFVFEQPNAERYSADAMEARMVARDSETPVP